jgi:glutathione S-transferase
VVDGDRTLIESGAIIESLVARYGNGRLAPPPDSHEYDTYLQWLHYAEGSAMLPLMLKLYVARLGEGARPLEPRIESEIANHLGYVDRTLVDRQWLLGDRFTAADVQMSFVGEVAGVRSERSRYPALDAWVKRFQGRPAYRRALDRGGPYALGPRDQPDSTSR